MRLSIALAFVLVAAVRPGPLLAAPDKYDVTPAEHAACDADAAALCSDAFPDQDLLLACMKAKRRQLSPSCSAVFTAGMKRRGMSM